MFKKLFLAMLLSLAVCSVAPAAEKNPIVLMETTLGNVKMELFADKAPISVKNFLAYANSGFYKDTAFHRVIPGFMAQGGGLTAQLQPKPGDLAPIKNEATNGLKNDRGTLAMARTGVVDSATSQFFINVVKVIEGMDVVDKMVAAPQTRKNSVFQNVPTTPIIINSIKVVK
jgi:peptidyl-prolyl cis-trans isomerase A (cyclophilin A)